MKQIIAAVLILAAFQSKGQGIYTPMTAPGYQYKFLKADSGFTIPFHSLNLLRGTTRPGTLLMNSADSLLYIYTGSAWKPVATDSAGVISQIAAKVDSVTVSGNNILYWKGGVSYGNQILTYSNTAGKYFNGYGGWASLPDTVRGYFSSGNNFMSYTSSTGVFLIDTSKVHSFSYLQTQFLGTASANNGDTLVGGIIGLGGSLSRDTYINGKSHLFAMDSAYTITLSALNQINLAAELGLTYFGPSHDFYGPAYFNSPVTLYSAPRSSSSTDSVLVKDGTGQIKSRAQSAIGGGSGTVTSIATTSPITGGTITSTGTIGIDTSIVHSWNYINAAKQSTGLSWNKLGNADTDTTTDFLGTTDSKSLLIKTNSTTLGAVFKPSGFFGVNTLVDSVVACDVNGIDCSTIHLNSHFGYNQNSRAEVLISNYNYGDSAFTSLDLGRVDSAGYLGFRAIPSYTRGVGAYAGWGLIVAGSGLKNGLQLFADNGIVALDTRAQTGKALVVGPYPNAYVGVNTTSPTSRLEVFDSVNAINYLKISNPHTGSGAATGWQLNGKFIGYHFGSTYTNSLGWTEGNTLRGVEGNMSFVLDDVEKGFKFWGDAVGTPTVYFQIKALGIINYAPPEYTDNSAAISGGLVAGDHYRTGDIEKVVH